MIKVSVYQEDITLLKLYAPSKKAFIICKLINVLGEVGKCKIVWFLRNKQNKIKFNKDIDYVY